MTAVGAVFLPQFPPELLRGAARVATGAHAVTRLDAERLRWGFDPAQDVGVAGEATAVADAVRRWADVGADTVVLQPTSDEPDPEGFLRFVAAEVQPLVR